MTPSEFDFLSGFLKEQSGLVLTPDKMYLVETRLKSVAAAHNCDSLADLVAGLRKSTLGALGRDVVEAMTTNETSFFRDKHPFDTFEKVLMPALIEARKTKRSVRIWCAAASSGQEPYSLAMILDGLKAQLAGMRWEIVATDIDTQILDKAKTGIYTAFEVQRGLPVQNLVKYFTQLDDGNWKFKDEFKRGITFKQGNLLKDFSLLGKFDIIFCRNVLIYFDPQTKGEVLDRMSKSLNDDGYVFLGGAETVLGITDALKSMSGHRGVYVKGT